MIDLTFIDSKHNRRFSYERVLKLDYAERGNTLFVIGQNVADGNIYKGAVLLDTIDYIQIEPPTPYADTDSVED